MFNGMNGLEILNSWPRYESGELVGFGDDVSRHGNDFEVNVIALYRDGSFSLNFWAYSKGERVRRPAVLAADGEPLKVGQTVWHIATGREYTVRDCTNGGAHLSRNGKPAGYCRAEYLTHQRPVLGADGVPIKKGDTVWLLDDCGRAKCECEVIDTCEDVGEFSVMVREVGKYRYSYVRPSSLTHTNPEPPDSYCRLYADMAGRNGNARTPNGISFGDFMRRCRALAERERG